MSLGGNDLLITNPAGESHGYVIATMESTPVVHSKTAPNVPLPTSTTSPTTAGGVYDVRDSEGDKALANLDWTLGSGQKSLDLSNSNASKFWDSSCIDISQQGQITLLRPVVNTAVENMVGPVYSALGYLWMGDSLGNLKYTSNNGENWTSCTGYTSTAPISGFATDGTRVYISIPSGASNSIYANTAADIHTFAKFGSTGTTVQVRHLAYQGGILFAATTAYVAMVDPTTGVVSSSSTGKTPSFLNTTMTSVALVASGNSVYWIVSQGAKSYVYQLTIDANATTMYTSQYMEMPTGFVATCGLGYLSMVYVGGYFQSATTGVGKGSVYICSDGYASPLFEIGTSPELTIDPTAATNDNRIWAMCAGSKDMYVLTNRAAYRWDIGLGGLSHVFDFLGTGSSQLVTAWNAGSIYSWDGTDQGNAAPHYQFPTGWTRSVTGSPVWDYTGGVATMTSASGTATTTIVGNPAAAEALSNASGTTVAVTFGAACNGWPNAPFSLLLQDGTRAVKFEAQTKVIPFPSSTAVNYAWLYSWSGSAWVKAVELSAPADVAHTATLTLKGTRATLTYDDATGYTDATKVDATSGTITITFTAFPATRFVGVDSITLNSVGSAASGYVVDALYRPSLAHCRGNLMAPYAIPTENKTVTITSISKASPTVITAAAHGILAGGTQVVNISGSNSTPSADGNWVATRTGADTFTIPLNVSGSAGSAGIISYNHSTGYSKTGTGVAASGTMTQSKTSFHSGSLLKDFRYADVAHDPLPSGAVLSMNWSVDGTTGNAVGATTGTHTLFTINQIGYSIQTSLTMTCDTTATVSPVVKAVNVVWDFVRSSKHQYTLDCRTGANNGRWAEDPSEAISFLFDTAEGLATFEDRFVGNFTGSIIDAEFLQAAHSPREGYTGLVKIVVRESS